MYYALFGGASRTVYMLFCVNSCIRTIKCSALEKKACHCPVNVLGHGVVSLLRLILGYPYVLEVVTIALARPQIFVNDETNSPVVFIKVLMKSELEDCMNDERRIDLIGGIDSSARI